MQADHMPNRVCLTCCELLTRYYVFRNECMQSHNALQKYENIMVNRISIEEKVRDQPASGNVPPPVEDTTTIIELNKDLSASTESVVIKVEVDDEEYIIDADISEEDDPLSEQDTSGVDESIEGNSMSFPELMAKKREIDKMILDINERMGPIETSSKPKIENKCQICNRIFQLKKQLTHHLNAHMPDNRCVYCNKYFEKSFVLRRHLKSHSGIYFSFALCQASVIRH